MARKYFGQWLLEKSIISIDTLLAAVAMQKDSNKPLGEIAVEFGFLSDIQVRAIAQEQRRTNSFFGEIAVEKKLMSDEQLEKLLAIQKNRRVLLGEALVYLRGLNEKVMNSELELFLRFNKEEEDRLQEQLESLEQAPVVKAFLDMTVSMLQRIIRGPVRLSGILASPRHDNNLRYSISQRVGGVPLVDKDPAKKKKGGGQVIFSLALPDRLILFMASAAIGIEQTELHEFTLDTTANFVSTIARNTIEGLECLNSKPITTQPQILDLERLGAPVPSHVCLEISSPKGDFQGNFLFA